MLKLHDNVSAQFDTGQEKVLVQEHLDGTIHMAYRNREDSASKLNPIYRH